MNNNNENTEIWKWIQGYENLYQISNIGRIKRFYKGDFYKKGPWFKILKPYLHKGYFRVSLSNSNHDRKDWMIHKLVALTFISNINNLPCINHKNGKKLENTIENLEWITQSDNMKHAWKNGFINNNHCIGEKSNFAKITEELVRKIKQNYIPRKFGIVKLSKKFNIGKSCVNHIISGNTWKHVII